jgi:hypothetical protein
LRAIKPLPQVVVNYVEFVTTEIERLDGTNNEVCGGFLFVTRLRIQNIRRATGGSILPVKKYRNSVMGERMFHRKYKAGGED